MSKVILDDNSQALMLAISLPSHVVDVLATYSRTKMLSRSFCISTIASVAVSNFYTLYKMDEFFDYRIFLEHFIANYKYSKVYLEHKKSLNTTGRTIQYSCNVKVFDFVSEMLVGTDLKPVVFFRSAIHVCGFEFFRTRNFDSLSHDQVLSELDLWFWNRIGIKLQKAFFVNLFTPVSDDFSLLTGV